MLIKILDTIDVAPIIDEYARLEPNMSWADYGFKGKQVGLQHKINEDVWASAVGRSSGDEFASSILNPFFKNTVFEELINKYKLFKTRLMWLNPYACYSMHQDESPRIHIPLVTNSQCYFIFKAIPPYHLAINNVYLTDTTRPHSFMNCSEEPRLHLVGAVQT